MKSEPMIKPTGKRAKAKADPNSVRSFVPETDFVGKPFGADGGEMHFRAGVPSSPVPQSYIDSLSPKKTG